MQLKNILTGEKITEMKSKSTLVNSAAFFVLFSFYSCSTQKPAGEPIFPEDHAAKLEWWKDARFGMFIHWGPVSLKGTEIGWSRGREIPVSTYDSLYLYFDPVNFNADEWVSIAKSAGMKYIVFTSKHHDGFCNWDTEYTDYNIMNSPFRRDVMEELDEACKKQGMALGFYHSTCDWHNPDFPLTSPGGSVEREVSNLDRYTEYLKNQSVEIIEKYGPLLVMWYDVPQRFDSIRGQGVINRIREVQPGILVNNRTGAPGDFDTPEQRVGSFQNNRPWETCMTIATQWAWKPNDEVKSLEQCLHSLIRSAGGDGNLLFNVGPKPDGTIEPMQVERLKEMGSWLKEYGFTIYGTRGGPFKPSDWGVSTRKENKIYLHVLNLPGNSTKIVLPDFGLEISACRIAGGKTLQYSTANGEIVIEFGDEPVRSIDTIVEITVNGNVMGIPPMETKPVSLSFKKQVTGSSNQEPHWSNHQWVDIKSVTNGDWSGDFWHPTENDTQPWLKIDLGNMMNIKGATIYERGNNIVAYEIQYKNGDEWRTLVREKRIGDKADIEFPETEMQQVKLVMKEFTGTPGIYEIALY
jgi:alpha-L-fucosidase